MSSVQTNVSFQNGVNGGNALQRALNEIDDYLLYLGTGHFLHVESTAQVIITSNIIFPFIMHIMIPVLNRFLFSNKHAFYMFQAIHVIRYLL